MSQPSAEVHGIHADTSSRPFGVLPYDAHEAEVLAAMEADASNGNRLGVTIVELTTGSGKTLRFPHTCLTDAARRGVSPRVWTSIPLSMGVRSVTDVQRKFYSKTLRVGHAASGVCTYNKQTQLIYATTEHVCRAILEVLRSCGGNHQASAHRQQYGRRVQVALQQMASHINVDEAHCDTTSNYLLLALVRHVRQLEGYDQTEGPIWSVLSATLTGSSVMQMFPNARVVRHTAPRFPVKTIYQGSMVSVATMNSPKALLQLLVPLLVDLNHKFGHKTTGKDILLFTAGSQSVNQLVDGLNDHVDHVDGTDVRHKEHLLSNCVVLRCFSQLLPAESDLVFECVPMNDAAVQRWMKKHSLTHDDLVDFELVDTIARMQRATRKIIVSTNVAESSITIDGLVAVVNLPYEKTMVRSADGSMQALKLRLISRASSQQRAGRAGRMQPGEYHVLCDRLSHEALAEHTPSSFFESDITSILLELLEAHQDPVEVLNMQSLLPFFETMIRTHKLGLIQFRTESTVQDLDRVVEMAKMLDTATKEAQVELQRMLKTIHDRLPWLFGNSNSVYYTSEQSRRLAEISIIREILAPSPVSKCAAVARCEFDGLTHMWQRLPSTLQTILSAIIRSVVHVHDDWCQLPELVQYSLYLVVRQWLPSFSSVVLEPSQGSGISMSSCRALFLPENIVQTDMAKTVMRLRMPLRDAVLLYRLWDHCKHNADEMVYMVGLLAMLHGDQGYWWIPRKAAGSSKRSQDDFCAEYHEKKHDKRVDRGHKNKPGKVLPSFKGNCDLSTLINVLSYMFVETAPQHARHQLVAWSNQHSMNNKALTDARGRVRQMLGDLARQRHFHQPNDDNTYTMEHATSLFCRTDAFQTWLRRIKPFLREQWVERRFEKTGPELWSRPDADHHADVDPYYRINSRISFCKQESFSGAVWSYSQLAVGPHQFLNYVFA